jgi:tetratricopeptide (TPR) repeat protein
MLYLAKAVWPARLSFFYPHPGGGLPILEVALASALLIAITAAVLRQRTVRPSLAVDGSRDARRPVPVIGLIQVGAQRMADRYTYIPLIGPFLAVVWGLDDAARLAPRARRLLAPAGAAALLALTIASWSRTRDWRDSETLFRRALEVQADNWLAHNDLGVALYRSGRLQEASEHFRTSIRLEPGNGRARSTSDRSWTKGGRTRPWRS